VSLKYLIYLIANYIELNLWFKEHIKLSIREIDSLIATIHYTISKYYYLFYLYIRYT